MNTTVTLNTGAQLPVVGFGTARLPDEPTRELVRQALEVGYRSIDTAASYGNEAGVGRGIADSGVPREEIFLTTKLRGADQGYEQAKQALGGSLRRLGVDYVDLYLIHWPLPRLDRYVQSWRAMEELLDAGLVRAIGVSNFLPGHLDRLAAESGIVPAVNQIELHPRFPQAGQRADDARRGIVTESWSPLGQDGTLLRDPIVERVAAKHGRTPAQVILRWHLQLGAVVIPKASSRERIAENLDVFGFALDDEDLALCSRLNTETRVNGQHPDEYEEL